MYVKAKSSAATAEVNFTAIPRRKTIQILLTLSLFSSIELLLTLKHLCIIVRVVKSQGEGSGVAIGGSAGSRNRGPRRLGAPDRGHNLFYLQDSEGTPCLLTAFIFLFPKTLTDVDYIS